MKRLAVSFLLLASAVSASTIGGGIFIWAPEAEVTLLDEDSETLRRYKTNAGIQTGFTADYRRFRLGLSAPGGGAGTTITGFPVSRFHDASLSWFSDSVGFRVRYQTVSGFYSDDEGLVPRSDPSMRLSRLDLEAYLFPKVFGFPQSVNFRDGLLSTGAEWVVYFRARYSGQWLKTSDALLDPTGEENGFELIDGLNLHDFAGTWGLVLQTNLHGFYLDPSVSAEGGFLWGSAHERYGLDQASWRANVYGVKVSIFDFALATGYRNQRFQAGLEAAVENGLLATRYPVRILSVDLRAFLRLSF